MKTKHILIIEDEEHLRDAIAKSLIEEGFLVSQLSTAEEALLFLNEHKVDLILLDLMLPGQDGFELIPKLRENEDTSKIPIIVMTARDEISHRITGLDLGADDYLTKPFHLLELKARIRARLRHVPEINSDEIQVFTRFKIEKKSRQAHIKDDNGNWSQLTLTSREFDILWSLASRPDQKIPRGDILNDCLPEDADSFTNGLDVHIFNLRRKIGPGYINTVYRVGFRFADPCQ